MHGNALWADYVIRIAQGWAGGTKRWFEQSGCGARPIAPCSCAHKCATKHTALRALHDKSCRCCFFYAVGNAGIGGGSADAPNPGAGGAHIRPAPLPRIAPAPEKSIKWHSVRGPPHGWRSRDRRPPRPASPGSCPEACSPVSSPGGWRWCSPPGILGRRCWPPRLLCRRWASMNAVPPGTRRRKGGR